MPISAPRDQNRIVVLMGTSSVDGVSPVLIYADPITHRVLVDSSGGSSSPLTTKGDLFTYDTANARLPVGNNGEVLSSDNTAATGLKWIALAGGGDMVLAAAQTVTGLKTFGTIGGAVGKFALAGSTSGSTIVNAAAVAGSTTITLPGATDTLVGKATTDTFTNKTFDTAGAGNSFSINGTAISAVTGSGSVVLATSPTLVTPTLGVASATTINKLTITAPATGSTLTIDDGFTLHVTGNVTAFSGSSTGANTGDQTSVSGNAGTATALQNARTLWGQSFDGTGNVSGSLTAVADITGGASSMNITAGTGNSRTLIFKTTTSGGVATTALTLGADQSSTFAGTVALGANNLTMTGSLAVTGSRVTKGWFTDLESTNMPTVGGTVILTSLTAPQFTTIELGAASDTTLSRVSAGVIAVEGVTVDTASNTLSLTNKTLTSSTNVLGGVTMTLGSDADGDVYYRASSVLTRLAKGTAGQVLAMNGGATAPIWSSAGAGTVTNTGGNLTSNAIVLGAGTADTKVVAGIITDGTSMITLGVNTTTLGKLKLFGNTSGDATIQPAAVAGTATVLTLPAATGTLATLAGTETFTNKRITPRSGTTASSATPTINTDNVDFYSITALAAAITSFTTNLSGTPTEAQTLWLAITDNGTARAITWGTSFEASTVALPTTTVISTRLDVRFVWNTVTSKWRCVGVA